MYIKQISKYIIFNNDLSSINFISKLMNISYNESEILLKVIKLVNTNLMIVNLIHMNMNTRMKNIMNMNIMTMIYINMNIMIYKLNFYHPVLMNHCTNNIIR